MVFSRQLPWRGQSDHPRGDDEGPVGTGEHGAESLDGAPVDLTDFLESQEIMDEAGMDHGVRLSRSTAQAFQVLQIAPMHLGTSSGESLGSRIRAGQTQHLMAS